MWKLAPAIGLVLAACATGTAVRGDQEGARFAVAADAGTVREFPRARDPQLPSVDLMSRRIRNEVDDDVASAEVRLCISGDGRVRNVQLLRGSSSWAFDQALVHDMSDWQFSEIPGSARQSCEIAKVSYRVH